MPPEPSRSRTTLPPAGLERIERPAVRRAELALPPVQHWATGWDRSLDRLPVVRLSSWSEDSHAATPVFRVQTAPPPPAVQSYVFAEAADARPRGAGASRRAALSVRPKTSRRRTSTRLSPPRDLVRLKDRLFYVLQPPLESLVDAGHLEFPAEPFPFQWQGIAFLYPRHAAVLADEMGLGKTVQAITALRLLLHQHEIRSVLLVCPKPLVSNWQREFARWAPELPVHALGGDRHRRRFQWQASLPVTLANYELLLRDLDHAREAHFDLVVLDEAQRIKNRASATSRAIREVSRHRAWALTGTPIENSEEDLVGIFEYAMPGYLRSGMPLLELARAAGEYVLRRTKSEVLEEMPPKVYRDATLALTPVQHASYQLAEERGVIQLESLGAQLTVQHVFELVLRLKQICNFDPATGESSKLERLEADLEEVAASGRKAIVFSQWVKTLEYLRDRLQRFGPLAYHGRVPARRRDAVLERFRRDEDAHVLLMSYGAGSVGLNLQFCNYVFLFDRWWNPAVEDQAINRAHRIGVQDTVVVTRMISEGTIEERIDQILQQKREMAEAVFAETGVPGRLGLNQEEILHLFQRTPRAA